MTIAERKSHLSTEILRDSMYLPNSRVYQRAADALTRLSLADLDALWAVVHMRSASSSGSVSADRFDRANRALTLCCDRLHALGEHPPTVD